MTGLNYNYGIPIGLVDQPPQMIYELEPHQELPTSWFHAQFAQAVITHIPKGPFGWEGEHD